MTAGHAGTGFGSGARELRNGFLLTGGTGGWLLIIGINLVSSGLTWWGHITDRVPLLVVDEAGMSTVEYSIV